MGRAPLGCTHRGTLAQRGAPGEGAAIFESWVAAELLKARYHAGHRADLHHLRTARREEIDLVLDDGPRRLAIEVKSGRTVVAETLRPLERLAELLASPDVEVLRRLVYGGDEARVRAGVALVPWHQVGALAR